MCVHSQCIPVQSQEAQPDAVEIVKYQLKNLEIATFS